ncbi:DUF5050 domain-containing protein [Paenibacillus aestuarii]|uniref:DUF5050 domain-containing protein n=1 Tax=Paenibacillus aestuarii TaxID=516965 RepID=A0ABW0KI99_9BACL|nr:DUF5050 domain-containing protein [Paenibacillus aestuarii]
MSNRKKISLLSLVIGACWMMLPAGGHAAESSVKVTLPNFQVKLNGHVVDNPYRQYPLLVYKDITYFPMTYFDSRMLGLVSTWSAENGLAIQKDQVTAAYHTYESDKKNAVSNRASIASFDITVNGHPVNNAKQEYPLLTYKDVTYFPLTWAYAHDQFGWNYTWDAAEGLTIDSDNPQLEQIGLPAEAGANSVALYKGYYYYTLTNGSKNEIYRAPVNDLHARELVYTYDIETAYGLQKMMGFELRNDDELWFNFHLGGGIMGHDEYGKIAPNGHGSIEHRGYLNFEDAAIGTVIVDYSVPPSSNNLWLIPQDHAGTHEAKSIGNPNFLYGWHTPDGGATSFARGTSSAVRGNDVYVLASETGYANNMMNYIYKVNVTTNQTVKVVRDAVSQFAVRGNELYYIKQDDSYIYSFNLDGTNESKRSARKATSWYISAEGNLYYLSLDEQGANHLFKAMADGDDKQILPDALQSVEAINNWLICTPANGRYEGLIILDPSGKLLAKMAEPISSLFIHDGQIVMTTTEDHLVVSLGARATQED